MVRENGRILSAAGIVAVVGCSAGRRAVRGNRPYEAATFWTAFLRRLGRCRGRRGVQLVVSDAHADGKAAVAKMQRASWQRYRVHVTRNALAHAGKSQHRPVLGCIATVFAEEDADGARAPWREVADQLRPRVSRLAAVMDHAEEDVLAFITFPKDDRTKCYSTKPLERLNREITRRADIAGSLPNGASVTHRVGAFLIERGDEWVVKRALDITRESIAPPGDDPLLALLAAVA